MSKNKKKQSRMSDATKENLKLGASSLISNEAVVTLGQKKPWYGAVVTAVLSVVLAALPILTQNLSAKGSEILNAPSYGFENGLVAFQQAVKTDGTLTFDVADKKLSVDSAKWNAFVTSENGGGSADEPWYHHVSSVTNKVDFAVFVTDLDGTDFTEYASKVYQGINPTTGSMIGASTIVSTGDASPSTSTSTAVHSNTIIFGKSSFRVMKAGADGAWKAGSASTIWDYSAGELPVTSLSTSTPTDAASLDTYITDTKAAWATYLDKAFNKQKVIASWRLTGIMAGIFAFFVFFMGLMIFIMTRGKNNPYRIYTFWMTQKMAYWAAFTPGLLAMILGFFMSGSILQFLFIFLFGMRVMWLSMKTLRPQA